MQHNWIAIPALLCLIFTPARAQPRPPNIVMIISDDQGWNDFGFMGHEIIKTPHLDQLARKSAVFPQGYVPTSLCRASLATLLTGQYAHDHKICCNDPPEGVDRKQMHPFIRNWPTLPKLLQLKGFSSFQTGKFWEGHFSNAGFTEGMTLGGRHGDEGLAIGRETMQPIYDFIERAGDKPFFVWYAPMLPHNPHDPPERLLKKYVAEGRDPKLSKYYAMCEWLDETCGQLLQHLDQRGLHDDTLILFVIDNGWIQGTGPVKTHAEGWFMPRSKLSPYDGGVRTPMMISWPGHTKTGRYDDLVSTIDVLPTLLAACEIKPPEPLPGVNLLGRATGGPKLERDTIFGEIFEPRAVDLENPARSLTHRWVRQDGWKLIVHAKERRAAELYHIAEDPLETRDLAQPHPERVKELAARIDAWWPAKTN